MNKWKDKIISILRNVGRNISQGWNSYRHMATIKECGFDVFKMVEDYNKLKAENELMKDKNAELQINITKKQEEVEESRAVITNFRNIHNEFPSMLRKMWSGGEIVKWIKFKQRQYLKNKHGDR